MIIITCILFLLCLIFKKSNFLYFVTFAWCFILMGLNTQNADTEIYKILYLRYGTASSFYPTEPFFQIMCRFFYNIGLSY